MGGGPAPAPRCLIRQPHLAVGFCLEARSGQGEEADGGPGLVLSLTTQNPHSGSPPCPSGTEKDFLDSFYYFLAFIFYLLLLQIALNFAF